MNTVLLLGAGMVAKPLVDYLLFNNFQITIASRTVSKAEKLSKNHPNAISLEWKTDDIELLEKLVKSHDLTVSLLPYSYHVQVAKLCIKHHKHMVTTSYVSDEMKALDAKAKKAGVLILNEIGVDPGFDHMTAMAIIEKVKNEGGKIKQFYSVCGALAAPEEANNPFRYKFSWSPKGVIMAGNNGAKFLKNNKIVEIPTENLFKNPLKVDFPEVGEMEVYPNRDSLKYIELYNLPDIETMYRGTFRYPHWCEIMDAIKSLGMVNYDKLDLSGKTYKELVAEQIQVYPKNVKEKVAEKLKLELDSPAIIAMDWLGYFKDYKIRIPEGSTFDVTADLMLHSMMLEEGARDMVIMQHSFLIENRDGQKEVIQSRLLDFATAEDTSIARTVALPAAIAVKLIMEGKITETGVKLPLSKTIYKPILAELATLGITMTEKRSRAESEKLL